MNYSQRIVNVRSLILIFCLALSIAFSSALANAQSTSSGAGTTAKPTDPTSPTATAPAPPPTSGSMAAPATTTKPSGAPSAQEIAAAKSSGKVWVNTETGVYHKSGRWYGKTKTGKFMTESEAKVAGYKEAHR